MRSLPAVLTITFADMGQEHELTGFLYLPPQDGNAIGNVDRYAIHVSADGRSWSAPVATGEFPNIINSPDQQMVKFSKPVNGRYFKFVTLHAAAGECVCAAEIGVVGSGPKSGAATSPGTLAPANRLASSDSGWWTARCRYSFAGN